MKKDEEFVSIIIPTYQRGELLLDTVQHILNQEYSEFELIIVDQSSQLSESVYRSLVELSERHPYMHYLHIAQPSLPAARNEGIRRAKGSILLFGDDDIIPEDRWISGHVANYRYPEVGGVVGKIVELLDRDPIGDKLGQKKGKVGYITSWGRPIRNFNINYRTEVQTVGGGNMSFRNQVLHQAGLFDEQFTGNAQFEETDLSFRIRKLGYKLIYDPIPGVQHLSAATGGCRNTDKIAWYHDYFFNKGLFFRKNMPLRTHLLFFIAHGIIAIREGILRGQSINKTLYLMSAMVSGYQLGRTVRK